MNFSRWFKAQGADFLDMRLRKLPAGLFKHFYFLRCVAACNGGALPPVEKIAFLLGSRAPVVERRLAALREAGLIAEESGVLRIVEGEDDGAADAPEPLSGAERTKRWRERRAGDADVTPRDAIEEDQKADTDFPRVTRDESLWERFDEFTAVFPARDDGPPSGPVVAAAWRKAIVEGGARPDELIRAARAYAEKTAGRERRFIVSAARWLSECRWRAAEPPQRAAPAEMAGVWIKQGSAAWSAWTDHWLATKGKRPPIDAKGGWRFPSLAPPEMAPA